MRFDRRNSRKLDKHYTQQVMRITQFINKISCWIFFDTFYFKTSIRNKHLIGTWVLFEIGLIRSMGDRGVAWSKNYCN